MIRINKYILGILLVLSSSLPILAQSSTDGYNPDSPSEPSNIDQMAKHKVTVMLGTEGAGTVSGGGYYKYGTNVTIKATEVLGYKFAYWLKDNETEPYKTTQSFTHTVNKEVKFTAVYKRVKLVGVRINDEAAGKVTASIRREVLSGEEREVAVLNTTANKDYFFQHWLKNDETKPYSTEPSLIYPLGDEEWEVNFTAVYKYVYNPDSPGEPSDIDKNVKHNVTVSLNDERAGVVSGTGRYKYGTTVTVSTSGKVGYEFKGWVKNGQRYSTEKSFTYTVGIEDVEFIAEYVNTAEELEMHGHALNLETNQQGSCTFSMESGTRFMPDDVFTVEVYPGTDQVFDGWYLDGSLVATTTTYSSYMGNKDITLSAHFRYVPDSPDEPTNPGGYVEEVEKEGLLGDVNGDGVVDMEDVVSLINIYLGKTSIYNISICDINKDKIVDMEDVVSAINIYLKKQ